MAATDHAHIGDLGARVGVQMLDHPVALFHLEGAELAEFLTSEHVTEEIHHLFHVRHGQTEMIEAALAGHAGPAFLGRKDTVAFAAHFLSPLTS